jgi:hypothetical protein
MVVIVAVVVALAVPLAVVRGAVPPSTSWTGWRGQRRPWLCPPRWRSAECRASISWTGQRRR